MDQTGIVIDIVVQSRRISGGQAPVAQARLRPRAVDLWIFFRSNVASAKLSDIPEIPQIVVWNALPRARVRAVGVANSKRWGATGFDYDGVDTLVEAGDCVHQRPGIIHSLYDWSDDMEFMEIIMPADFDGG